MRDLGLTLAGGGNRSFYQQGLLQEWGTWLWPRVAAVACSSAGAASAILLLSNRVSQARARWDALRRDMGRNFDLMRLTRGAPLLPHGRIYHETMLTALRDGGLARIQQQPFPIYVLCSRPPSGWSIPLAVWLGIGAYEVEKRIVAGTLHPKSGSMLGFREHVVDARSCQTPEELADLVLASSSMPPFTSVGRFRGESLLDGGLIDNVPAFVADRAPHVAQNLVLLTRVYSTDLRHAKRLYIQPSQAIAVKRWDYSPEAPVDAAVALGIRDARHYRDLVASWLGTPAPSAMHGANSV